MKKIKSLYILAALAVAWCMFSLSAFASNDLVPYTPPDSGQPAQTTAVSAPASTSTVQDYAGELFPEITISPTPEVTEVTNNIANIASIILTFVIGVVPVLLGIQIIIDLVCLLLKPVAQLCSHLPFQINSDEVIMITGIQYTKPGEGNQSTNIEKKDLKGENPFLFYAKSRIWTILLAFSMLLLLGSGVLFKLIFFAANWIVGFIAGIAPI